jgi:hypothetical protein
VREAHLLLRPPAPAVVPVESAAFEPLCDLVPRAEVTRACDVQ